MIRAILALLGITVAALIFVLLLAALAWSLYQDSLLHTVLVGLPILGGLVVAAILELRDRGILE